jgi:hypothetical protein
VAAALPMALSAQTTSATLVGDITDTANASIPQARVSMRNVATGLAREVQTDENGSYRITPLNPGFYEVTVSKSGFQTQVAKEIKLEVAATVKLDFQLGVSSIAETINVSAAAPILQTQDASTGNIVTTDDVLRIPVNGRNFTRLILLMPGSSDQGGSQTRGVAQSGTQLISVRPTGFARQRLRIFPQQRARRQRILRQPARPG